VRKRYFLLAAAAVASGLAVFRTVDAQTLPPAGTAPKTAPAGAPAARGTSDWTTTAPGAPTGYATPPQGKTAPKQGGYLQSGGAASPQPAAQPGRRLTNPVVAGPDGVRPAGGEIPPPTLELTPPSPGVIDPPTLTPEPKGTAEPPPAAIPQPPATLPMIPTGSDPRPAIPPITPPAVVAPPSVTPPTPPAVTPVESEGAKAPTGVAPLPVPFGASGSPAPAPASHAGQGHGAKQTQTVTIEAVCPETVNYGGEFRYELVVKNGGTSTVAGVRVEDEIPVGSKYIGSDPPAEMNGDRLVWLVGALEGGAEKRIAVRVKPTVEGDLLSKATVTYAAAVEARTKVTRPRISVAVNGVETCKAGEETIFHIKVTNSGSGPAQQMVVQALLSDGLLHSQGLKLEMAVASLAAGETKTVPLRVNAAKAGNQTCLVTVGAMGVPDTASKASVNVVEPVLHVAQTGPARCYVRGSEPVYEIKLSNTGTAATDAVTVYSVLPEGFEFVDASDGGSFSAANRAVVWKVAPMAPAAGKAFTLKVRATVAGEGTLRTIAQSAPEAPAAVGAGGVAAKPAGRVLEAKAETAVKAEGVAAVRFEVIDLDDPVEAGKEAVYEIRVMNQGTGACTNVQLVAAVAEGTTYTGSSGPTQVKAQGQNLIFDPIATLAAKGEAVYRVKVRGTAAGDLRFRVQLTCDQVRTPVVKEESTRFFKE